MTRTPVGPPTALAAALLLWTVAAYGQPQSSDDWFKLTITIQRDIEQADFESRPLKNINAEDRRFVQKMLNELTATEDAMPTAAQAKWLLAIKEWVKR